MAIRVVRLIDRLFSFYSSPCSFPCLSYPLLFSSHFYLYSVLKLFFHVDSAEANNHGHFATRGALPLAECTPPTGYEHGIDDFHYSEISEMIFQEESGDIDTEPSYLSDAELDDETIGKALSSLLFIQEREESAERRQAYHSLVERLCQLSLFRTRKNGKTRART